MDEKYVKAFDAVYNFVDDLWLVYGNPKKPSPLALYRRLIGHIRGGEKEQDKETLDKVLGGFEKFLSKNESFIMENKLDSIPRGTHIKYGISETVFIDIQKFIYSSRQDADTREAIRQHLITISTILEPKKEKLDELEKRINELNIDSSTNEGKFITGIMSKAKTNMESSDMNNPGQAIMGLLSSGVIQEMISGLQHGVSSGEMDMGKLLGSMQSAIGSLMPPSSDMKNPSVEEIKDDEP